MMKTMKRLSALLTGLLFATTVLAQTLGPPPGGSSGITIGTTTITSGTTTRMLYDAAGVVGEAANITTDGTNLTIAGTGVILAPSGIGGAPSYSFSAQPTMGMYRGLANDIQFIFGSPSHAVDFYYDGSLGWISTDGINFDSVNQDTGINRVTTGVAKISSGVRTPNTLGWLQWGGQARVSTQFDKTSDTTLANVTGLSVTVVAGRTYTFVATLYTTSNVAGGVKAAIAGTATATNIIYEGEATSGAAIGAQTRASALAAAVAAITTVTAARIDIQGTITVNAGGTLTVQFAQNASNAAASSVLVGSTFFVYDMP